MARNADHRVMPSEGTAKDVEPPRMASASNLFAPISTANRITGNSRVRRQRANKQLAPGSSYEYGRDDVAMGGFDSDLPDPALDQNPYRIPAGFLRKTMVTPPVEEEPAAMGYGLRGLPTPDALLQAYTAHEQATFAGGMQPEVTRNDTTAPYPAFTPDANTARQQALPLWYTARRSQDTARQSQDTARRSQDTARQSQDTTRYSQDNAQYHQDNARRSQDTAQYHQDTARQSQDTARRAYPYANDSSPKTDATHTGSVPREPLQPPVPQTPQGERPPMPQGGKAERHSAQAAFDALFDTTEYPAIDRAQMNADAGRNDVTAVEPSSRFSPWEATTRRYVPMDARRGGASGMYGVPPAAEPAAFGAGGQTQAYAQVPGAVKQAGDAQEHDAASLVHSDSPAGGAEPYRSTQAPMQRNTAPRARRSERSRQDAPAQAAFTDPPATTPHQPYAGLGAVREVPEQDVQSADIWEVMGWKQQAANPLETTAVWKLSELTMFERDAFGEPLNPLKNPPESYGYQNAGYVQPPRAALDTVEPPLSPMTAEGYAPYGDTPPQAYRQAELPYDYSEPYNQAPSENRADAKRRPRRPQINEKKNALSTLRTMGPWRVALLTALTIGLLFCVIEGYKIVQSLIANERSKVDYLAEYQALAGADATQGLSGVELLPAGVTYAPTATPVPAQTPTDKPRVNQNDPLIGVMDGGGSQTADDQPVLPTNTPVTRSRLTRYPDNALLSISEAFRELRAENPDVVGRLTIEDVLSETVVQRNNTFYLNHNARGLLSATGAVFVDESCVLRTPPENLLLRGQASAEGKLFAPLRQYVSSAAFVSANGIVTLETIYETAQYVIFAVIKADSVANSAGYFNYAGYPVFQSDAQMLSYAAAAKQQSVYRSNVDVRATDRLLTLATVPEGGDTVSIVLLCRMLRNGETSGNIQQE